MAQSTLQINDALRALATKLGLLSFPLSGEKCFPSVVWDDGQGIEAPKVFPLLVLSVRQMSPDDDNGANRVDVTVGVEIRQYAPARDSGDAIIFGRGRTTDESVGAGLVDLMGKLQNEAAYLGPDDDAEIESYFELNRDGFSAPENVGKNIMATRTTYTGHIRIV